MSRSDELGRHPFPPVGPPAVLGMAIGFLLAGSVLLPHAAPYTIYLACMVALSGGALLQGWVLDGYPSVEVLEIVSAPTGDLRVERRAVGRPHRELRVLLEGGRVRGAEDGREPRPSLGGGCPGRSSGPGAAAGIRPLPGWGEWDVGLPSFTAASRDSNPTSWRGALSFSPWPAPDSRRGMVGKVLAYKRTTPPRFFGNPKFFFSDCGG